MIGVGGRHVRQAGAGHTQLSGVQVSDRLLPLVPASTLVAPWYLLHSHITALHCTALHCTALHATPPGALLSAPPRSRASAH